MNVFIKIWYNFLDAFVKVKDIKGRSNKFEFWSFVTVSNIIIIALGFLSISVAPLKYIFLVYLNISVVLAVSAIVRRIHDAGRSGWWVVVMFAGLLTKIPGIPAPVVAICGLIGIFSVLYIMVLLFCPSDKDNKYGPKPDCSKEEALFGNLLMILSLAIPSYLASFFVNLNQITLSGVRSELAVTDTATPQTESVPMTETLPTHPSTPHNSAQ